MAKEVSKNIRLGLLVLAGTSLLILAFYLIGSKQNLFGSTFILKANFKEVSGLMPGNNVRFTGIDVGTVDKVEIINDTTVRVIMIVEKKVQAYIKKNAIATIGTDGLMGNKLVNIRSLSAKSPNVEDGDVLYTTALVGMDEMMETLQMTNKNVKSITDDLVEITDKLNRENSVWRILMDTTLAENIGRAVVNVKIVSDHSAVIAGDLRNIVSEIKGGKGTVGALLMNKNLEDQMQQSIVNIKLISDSLAFVTGDLYAITSSIREGNGAIGTLLTDTAFANNLSKSMKNIESGTKGFDENMEALKHSALLRKYFKEQEKQKKNNGKN
jgi:phospholipid/cholesterol/gamma-HCH transport system substrate-binding protein